MGEFALKSRGLSLQAEYHYKTIDDRVNQVETELSGYYAQAGYFFSESWPSFPAPLELAVRYAQVDGRSGVDLPDQSEATLVGNWFFAGHRNKLSVDLSRLEESAQSFNEGGWRLRLQWDISI